MHERQLIAEPIEPDFSVEDRVDVVVSLPVRRVDRADPTALDQRR